MKKDGRHKAFVALCVAPATILFTVFMIIPTLNVFRMSLFERGAFSVYYGKNVPLFRRNGYRKPGAMIP